MFKKYLEELNALKLYLERTKVYRCPKALDSVHEAINWHWALIAAFNCIESNNPTAVTESAYAALLAYSRRPLYDSGKIERMLSDIRDVHAHYHYIVPNPNPGLPYVTALQQYGGELVRRYQSGLAIKNIDTLVRVRELMVEIHHIDRDVTRTNADFLMSQEKRARAQDDLIALLYNKIGHERLDDLSATIKTKVGQTGHLLAISDDEYTIKIRGTK